MGRQSILRRLCILVTAIFITALYLNLGAAAMRAIERPVEDEMLEEGQVELARMTNELNFTEEDFHHLEHSGLCNFHASPHWTYTGSLFYTLTVITTIGYGSFAPNTQDGRMFTAIYMIIGIGIVGQLLGNCALLLRGMTFGVIQAVKQGTTQNSAEQLVSDEEAGAKGGGQPPSEQGAWEREYEHLWDRKGGLPAHHLRRMLEGLTGDAVDDGVVEHVLKQVNPQDASSISPLAQVRAVALWRDVESELPRSASQRWIDQRITVTAAALWIFAWAAVFMFVELWSYRESLWFCLVTMTTVGFGDFTPDTHLGRGLCFLFIVPGLGLGAHSLELLWEVFAAKRYWWLQRMHARGRCSRKLLEAHDIEHALVDPAKCGKKTERLPPLPPQKRKKKQPQSPKTPEESELSVMKHSSVAPSTPGLPRGAKSLSTSSPRPDASTHSQSALAQPRGGATPRAQMQRRPSESAAGRTDGRQSPAAGQPPRRRSADPRGPHGAGPTAAAADPSQSQSQSGRGVQGDRLTPAGVAAGRGSAADDPKTPAKPASRGSPQPKREQGSFQDLTSDRPTAEVEGS